MRWIAVVGLAALTSGCAQDSCKKYSKFTCEQLKTKTYNVYYYDKPYESTTQREIYLGSAVGLASCGSAAWAASEAYREERQGEWSYICCLRTNDSSCAEKHR